MPKYRLGQSPKVGIHPSLKSAVRFFYIDGIYRYFISSHISALVSLPSKEFKVL